MSLYGSLFAGVAGLKAQSSKIGIISDNIANVNTVGYKEGSGSFQTLVTSNSVAGTYSPGGVLGSNRPLVSKQGLLQGTDSATDIAISGNGFFVVNTLSDGSGNTLFTRAGSFRQDNLGNFKNASGAFLLGWPLDREGRLPGEQGNVNTNSSANLTSLQVVNILTATGTAAATTVVSLSANLKASETQYPGASAVADMDSLTVNSSRPAKSIIAPGYIDGVALGTDVNHIERGDKFTITTGGGLNYTYRYGGFTYGRSVTSAANGDSAVDLQDTSDTLLATPFATTNGSNVVTVTHNNHGFVTGERVTFSGQVATVNNIPATELNASFIVTVVDADSYTITTASSANATSSGGTTGILATKRAFSGNIMDASTASALLINSTSTYATNALTFTITTQATGTLTFNYTSSTPNSQERQFNTLNNLADAINSVGGLTARVVDGRLMVGATDANAAITFANGQFAGTSGPPLRAGIDWIRELGLENVGIGDDRFNSLQSLADRVDASTGLNATIANGLTEAVLTMNVNDPLETISFSDLTVSAALAAFTSSTPFTTTNGSNIVTVNFPSPHGLSNSDLITLDPTGFSNYPALSSATNAFATTNASTTVTVTKTGHGYSNGDVIFIDPTSITGYPTGNINGIPLTDFDGNFTISGVAANTFNITVATAATSTASGGAGNFLASPTINGIPFVDFNGRFEVTVTGPSTVTVRTTRAATSTGSGGATGLIVTPPNNVGSLLAELGLVDSLAGSAFSVQALGPLGPRYDSADTSKNMAGGTIKPQYNQNVRIYDSLGTGHDLNVGFIKTGVNTWAVEVYTLNTSEVSPVYANGLLAAGSMSFNGDGSLRSLSASLATPLNILWSGGASASDITFNWGTPGEPFGTVGAVQIGKTDGMSQFDAAYRANFVNQNGAAVGQLVSVTITELGKVVANYNNGESQELYQIPIADFINPDALSAISGNTYQQSSDSGEPALRQAGTNGAGKIQPSALEASTADLSTQLTEMIVAQRAYQAIAKVITTAGSLLDELNQAVRT